MGVVGSSVCVYTVQTHIALQIRWSVNSFNMNLRARNKKMGNLNLGSLAPQNIGLLQKIL